MDPDYYNRIMHEYKMQQMRENKEREYYERERFSRDEYGNSSCNSEYQSMREHIAYLENKCRKMEYHLNRPIEDTLNDIDISVIEKFLRKKKLENLNKK